MLLDAVIIILREVLEAALLASLLLALGKALSLDMRWFFASLVVGLAGATIYAMNLNWVSELFDYSGQEIVNSLIQAGIFLLAGIIIARIPAAMRESHVPPALQIAMAGAIALAITREFSEIILYLQGFSGDQAHWYPVMAGSVIGAVIGLSIGTVFYYAFSYRPGDRSITVCAITLALVVAGILGQIAPQLQQIDLLPATAAVWNSASLLAEDSVPGQLLYAVLGYEAAPSPWHLGLYLAGLLFLLALYLVNRRGEPGL